VKILNDEKLSMEELAESTGLKHFGVKGMKWGVRNAPTTGDIKSAREKVSGQRDAVKKQKQRVSNTEKGSAQRASAEKKLSAMKMKLLKNPDRATALRLTRGQKWAVAGGMIGGFVVSGGTPIVPIGIGAAAATRYALRKNVEKKAAGK
jgi:hypothetical protein